MGMYMRGWERPGERAISVGHSVRACQSAARQHTPSHPAHSNILLNVQTDNCHSLILHPLISPDLPLKYPTSQKHVSTSSPIPHLFNVHVNRHPLFSNPCHVLWAPDVDLWDAIRWVFIEHHSNVPRVLASSHVLLVRALQVFLTLNWLLKVKLSYLSWDLYVTRCCFLCVILLDKCKLWLKIYLHQRLCSCSCLSWTIHIGSEALIASSWRKLLKSARKVRLRIECCVKECEKSKEFHLNQYRVRQLNCFSLFIQLNR